MKVLLINGSPNQDGSTYTALKEITTVLEQEQIEWEIFHIGNKPVRGCIGCDHCRNSDAWACVFNDDVCNEMISKMAEADGIIIGSPVYYAGPNGALCALLDRAFYSSNKVVNSTAQYAMRHKPAAAVFTCKRQGGTTSMDRLNKYFSISEMPIVTAQYWNTIIGLTPEDFSNDEYGFSFMRTIGKNMAWMLKGLCNS